MASVQPGDIVALANSGDASLFNVETSLKEIAFGSVIFITP